MSKEVELSWEKVRMGLGRLGGSANTQRCCRPNAHLQT
jgi:hypothetical protein